MIFCNLGLPKLSRPNFKKPCAVTGLRFIISIFRRFSTLTPPIPVPMTEVLVGVRRVFDTGWLGRVTGTLIWDTRSWICVPKKKFQNILPLKSVPLSLNAQWWEYTVRSNGKGFTPWAIRMSHWRNMMVSGAESLISCQGLRMLRKGSHWQLIQN